MARDAPSSLALVRAVAGPGGWTEIPAGDDPPSWAQPGGGRLSFEPGGQLELSSPVAKTASRLIRDLQCTAQLIASSFEREGIILEAIGVDPHNELADVPLQLHRPRYERMTRYFDSIGESGARMMRQTASLQINVEGGTKPLERWRLLSELSPYVTAIFANSPTYAGEKTGRSSYRAHLWRTLDPSRTGLPGMNGNPAAQYLEFALNAGAIMYGGDAPYPTFGQWIETGVPTPADWELHLTTLFPEVRPRRYFELRSADAISPDDIAAPISFVAGLVYDETSSHAAAELLDSSAVVSLETAGAKGFRDSSVLETSIQLVDLALAGCESLGVSYLSAADLASAGEFFDRYTRQGRSPGDDRA